MKFILARKLNMTQVFDKDGVVHPATIVEATPAFVTQVKTVEVDGYTAVQIGAGSRHANRINKPLKGHIKDLGNFSAIREFRFEGADGAVNAAQKVGDTIDLSQFQPGDVIEVSAISKG